MAEVLAGSLTKSVVKIAVNKLSSAIAQQGNLAWNFNNHLQDMKCTMMTIEAVLMDAEKQSVTKKEHARLWLKRLKNAAQDISDMMDNYQDQMAEEVKYLGEEGETTPVAGAVSICSPCDLLMPTLFSYLKAELNKMVLANEMKNMREELRKINEEARNFNFTVNVGANQEQEHYDRRETAAAVYETTHILGREGEKKKIIDILSASLRKDGTMVLPIYGLGGMGKTTLAQLVYNDTQFKKYKLRAWVYVSQDFDLKKIGRSVISQISSGTQNLNELHMIHHCLDNLLPGNETLIVLDDLWEENASELNKLKGMLHVGKKASMVDVLVTTRSRTIAKKIGTHEPHKLKPLKHLVCWDIIKRHSGFQDKSNKKNLEQIGLDFAKKCKGVPLAAQALGCLLNTEDLAGWLEMNQNNIWNGESTEVLPSLRLSYERMPPILRLCFSYCAIFPKGHDINENDLIYRWVSLDCIEKPSDGKKYIKQLLEMSFLQYKNLPSLCSAGMPVMLQYYTMHDLVHDLAISVLDDDELIIIDAANKSSNTREQKYCQYAVLTNYDGKTKLSNILPKKVRALHFSSSCQGLVALHDDSFSFTKCLRILDFSGCSGIMLPSSTGQLIQLRFLIAPKMQNERLPDSIGQLTKLQHLNLRQSSLMSTLPESIGGLKSLMHLDISDCFGITVLPESLGGLKSLVHLDMAHCFEITVLPESLGGLKSLVHLKMSYCCRITVLPESFGELESLVHLDMSWCYGITILPESLGGLKSLVHLDMPHCSGITVLPESLGGLKSLVHLKMSYCCNIIVLPESLGHLINLQYLSLYKCGNLKSLPDSISKITTLKTLRTMGCSHEVKDQAAALSSNISTLQVKQ